MAVRLAAILLVLEFTRSIEGKASEDSCVEIIVKFYGTEDGKEVMVQFFRQYDMAGAMPKTKSQPTPEFQTCVAKCREDKKCRKAIDNLEMKRSIKSMIRKFLATKLVIKTSIIGSEFIGYVIGIAADLGQFALHTNYAVLGKALGAAGNLAYGVLLGSAVDAPILGGGTALALWAYSEWFTYK